MPHSTPQTVVVALYKFVSLPDYQQLQQPLYDFCAAQQIKGTLLLAEEGINGTVAGSRTAVDALLEYLQTDPRLAALSHKESYNDEMPFLRLKIKLKKEIVTMGVPGTDPAQFAGERVDFQRWNELLEDPEVLVIDTRNQYEVDIGSFKNAVSPQTDSFREFPAYVQQNLDPEKHKKIAMFCTGGIRCEKSTHYLMANGFNEVYHLNGGILKYLEETPPEQSLWQGDCFVFDNRVAVNGKLEKSIYDQCYACRHPVSPEEMQSAEYEAGISCPHCYGKVSEEKKQRLAERQKQIKLAKQRGEQHIGIKRK